MCIRWPALGKQLRSLERLLGDRMFRERFVAVCVKCPEDEKTLGSAARLKLGSLRWQAIVDFCKGVPSAELRAFDIWFAGLSLCQVKSSCVCLGKLRLKRSRWSRYSRSRKQSSVGGTRAYFWQAPRKSHQRSSSTSLGSEQTPSLCLASHWI